MQVWNVGSSPARAGHRLSPRRMGPAALSFIVLAALVQGAGAQAPSGVQVPPGLRATPALQARSPAWSVDAQRSLEAASQFRRSPAPPHPTWTAGGVRSLPDEGASGPADPPRGQISLNVSRGRTLRFERAAASIFVADPSIADIQTPSNQVAFVFGKKAGRTSLFALDATGQAVAEYGITVTQPIEELRNLLRGEIGDYKLSVAYTPNGAVLTGTLPNAGLVESAKALTQSFIGSGGTVTNRVRISGALQVNLQVRVAEVNRRVLKQFGVNLAANARGFGFTSGGSAGGGSAAQTGSYGGRVGFSYSDGINQFTAQIDALAQDGLVTVLAEPNLTAVSGEKASFLAGGEFPIPVAQALGQTSVQFRRFGASLEFQPTVLASNLINVRVRPEVSELTPANGIEVNGLQIPGLSTRSADTVVELASGQSFAIGGLIRKNFATNVGLLPGLGDIPVLGALFRSSAFQKDESELVIIVTPYIVRPGVSPQALEAPTDRVAPPTDAGRILLNTLSKAPSGRLAPRKGSVGLTGEAGLGVE